MIRKRILKWSAIVFALVFSHSAAAQQAEQPRGVRSLDYKDVEKGFFFELNMGPLFGLTGFPAETVVMQNAGYTGIGNITPKVRDTMVHKFGFFTAVGIGYDIIDALSIDAGVNIAHWSSGAPVECVIGEADCSAGENEIIFKASPTNTRVRPAVSDIFGIAPRASVKFSFVSTYRWYFFVRAGGGVMLTTPEEVLGKVAPMVEGSLGFEYYAGLRHFSFGFEPRVYVLFAKPGAAVSLALTPTVKYTF